MPVAPLPDLDTLDTAALKDMVIRQHAQLSSHDAEVERLRLIIAHLPRLQFDLATVRFKTGVDSYLNVITAQTTVLTNHETEAQIELRQMISSVGLVMALGGGWNGGQLPLRKDLLARPPKWSPAGPMPALTALAPANPPPLPSPSASNRTLNGAPGESRVSARQTGNSQ